MTMSRPRDLTVSTSGADAAQRAMEDARSILKVVGKGMLETLLRSILTSPLSMPWAEMRGGTEDSFILFYFNFNYHLTTLAIGHQSGNNYENHTTLYICTAPQGIYRV